MHSPQTRRKQAVLWSFYCLLFSHRGMHVPGSQAKGESQKPFAFHVQ